MQAKKSTPKTESLNYVLTPTKNLSWIVSIRTGFSMNAGFFKCAKLLLRVWWCGWFYSRYCSLTLAWFKTIWTAKQSARSQYGNVIVLQSYSLTVTDTLTLSVRLYKSATSPEENSTLDVGCGPGLSYIIFITVKLSLPGLGPNHCFIPFNVSLSAGENNLILDDMERSVF